MTRFIVAASTLFLAFSSLPANSLTLTGVGSQSCQSWQNARKAAAKDSDADANWVFGYLDGLSASVNGNYAVKGQPRSDLLAHLDKQSIIKLVGIYCEGHPNRTLQQAAAEIGVQLIADDRSGNTGQSGRPSVATTVEIRQPRARAETTGSGDVTGSVRSARTSTCKVVDLADARGQTVHQLRKCD